jgi:hypothetical protein
MRLRLRCTRYASCVAWNLGRVAWNLGRVAWNLGSVAWNLGRVAWNLGRVAWELDHVVCDPGRVACDLGRVQRDGAAGARRAEASVASRGSPPRGRDGISFSADEAGATAARAGKGEPGSRQAWAGTARAAHPEWGSAATGASRLVHAGVAGRGSAPRQDMYRANPLHALRPRSSHRSMRAPRPSTRRPTKVLLAPLAPA